MSRFRWLLVGILQCHRKRLLDNYVILFVGIFVGISVPTDIDIIMRFSIFGSSLSFMTSLKTLSKKWKKYPCESFYTTFC